MRTSWIAAGLLTLCTVVAAPAADAGLEGLLKDVVDRNFKASADENLADVMETMHPESPAYDASEETLRTLFDKYDLSYELMSLRLVGQDGDYAVARVQQRTTRVKGAEFSNHTIDSFYIFRTDEGAWKLWHQVMIETTITE